MPDTTPGSGNTTPRTVNKRILPVFLEVTRTLLTNAQNPDVLSHLIRTGYTQQEIAARQQELENLRLLDERQKKEYGDQYEATQAYAAFRDELHEDYIAHLSLARIAFKDNIAARAALGLDGRRNVSQSGYLAQALLFYRNLAGNPEWVLKMGAKGVDEAEINQFISRFQQLSSLSATQQMETGEAQQATVARDEAWDKLAHWISDFRATAKIALRKFPQMQEQLGIKDPS